MPAQPRPFRPIRVIFQPAAAGPTSRPAAAPGGGAGRAATWVRADGARGQPVPTTRSKSPLIRAQARIRPNHGMASPPGCLATTTGDTGVPPPRGQQGGRVRRRRRRRRQAPAQGREQLSRRRWTCLTAWMPQQQQRWTWQWAHDPSHRHRRRSSRLCQHTYPIYDEDTRRWGAARTPLTEPLLHKGIFSKPRAIVPTCVLLVLVRLGDRVCASCWSQARRVSCLSCVLLDKQDVCLACPCRTQRSCLCVLLVCFRRRGQQQQQQEFTVAGAGCAAASSCD